jgi:thiol-disulfide isomerase/thioredoxin
MGKRTRPKAVALGAALIAMAVAGCSGGSSTGVSSSAVGGGVKTVVSLDQRKDPITLSGTTLEGKHLDLASLRGKPVVLNVWGSWCPPCRKEAPDLQAAATELGAKASFVGIDTREDAASQGLAYQRRFKITYPSLVDQGDLLLALRGAISSQSPPVTLVLDPQGRIAARFIGPVTRLTLVEMVHDVLKAT